MNLKNHQHHSAWFGLQVRSGQARPGCRTILDFWPGLQAPQVIPGQAAGQARPKKSGLLAALIPTNKKDYEIHY